MRSSGHWFGFDDETVGFAAHALESRFRRFAAGGTDVAFAGAKDSRPDNQRFPW
jgi:hypothetical protein